MRHRLYYVRCSWMCGGVITDTNGGIVKTCPILKKFLYLNLRVLKRWIEGKYKGKVIKVTEFGE